MSKIDKTNQELSKLILNEGRKYYNVRRRAERLQIPSYTLRHDKETGGFPLISTKKGFFNGVTTELIWFLRGDNDIEYLNKNKVYFWNKDAYNTYTRECKNYGETPMSFEKFDKIGKGSVGQNYSVQWRDFNGNTDQIDDLIKGMKKDVMVSRLKVNAWNPSELDKTALPPCHDGFQVIGVPLDDGKFGFEVHWNQRSVDTFLGLPLNVASYYLLGEFLEIFTGHKFLGVEGALKCVHFYDNQYEAAKEIVKRDVEKHRNCDIKINKKYNGDWKDFINTIEPKDIELIRYTSEKAIIVDMLAPIE